MYVISHNSLLLKKILTLHNVIIHIKSIFNDDKNNCYYNIFLEKCSYQLPKNNNKLQMPYCNRIAASERVDINKKGHQNSAVFVTKWSNFQLHVCIGCHDLLMIVYQHIATLNTKSAHKKQFSKTTAYVKGEAINSMQNIDLTEKSGTL